LYPNTEEGIVVLHAHLLEMQEEPLVLQYVAQLVDAIYGPAEAV
jgi:hypothetical protein